MQRNLTNPRLKDKIALVTGEPRVGGSHLPAFRPGRRPGGS